jgi:hypothetical protein
MCRTGGLIQWYFHHLEINKKFEKFKQLQILFLYASNFLTTQADARQLFYRFGEINDTNNDFIVSAWEGYLFNMSENIMNGCYGAALVKIDEIRKDYNQIAMACGFGEYNEDHNYLYQLNNSHPSALFYKCLFAVVADVPGIMMGNGLCGRPNRDVIIVNTGCCLTTTAAF